MNYPEILPFVINVKTSGKRNISLVDEYKVFEENQKAKNYASLMGVHPSQLKKRNANGNV
jgi:hypothetical protein